MKLEWGKQVNKTTEKKTQRVTAEAEAATKYKWFINQNV